VDQTTGETIPNEDVIIDNGDGTFSDINGDVVGEFGGAIDFAQDGSTISSASPSCNSQGSQR
jgi:hypothetical protein